MTKKMSSAAENGALIGRPHGAEKKLRPNHWSPQYLWLCHHASPSRSPQVFEAFCAYMFGDKTQHINAEQFQVPQSTLPRLTLTLQAIEPLMIDAYNAYIKQPVRSYGDSHKICKKFTSLFKPLEYQADRNCVTFPKKLDKGAAMLEQYLVNDPIPTNWGTEYLQTLLVLVNASQACSASIVNLHEDPKLQMKESLEMLGVSTATYYRTRRTVLRMHAIITLFVECIRLSQGGGDPLPFNPEVNMS
ncbi:hypothetical protein AB6D11_00035 [Vibrio splendidus]